MKKSCGLLEKISYVSKLLRSKILPKNGNQLHRDNINMTDHDAQVQENLWTYAKTFIERKKIILPAFDKQSCFIYFQKAFKVINPLKKLQDTKLDSGSTCA